MVVNSHTPIKLPYPTPCYYCWHGYSKSERKAPTFKCSFCNIPLHKSSYDKQYSWSTYQEKIIHEVTRIRL